MKKSDRISAFDPRYQGYFTCFNAQQYYEAHDVLEDLWLRTTGENHRFFKGLIQVAGAFVHLQKQHQHPAHAKHGRRLRPAARLFALALSQLDGYRPLHLALDVDAVCALCRQYAAELASTEFARNPWHPSAPPQFHLRPAA